MEITLREPWNWQNHRDNKRTYNAKIVPEEMAMGNNTTLAIEEKHLIQQDVDFLNIDEITGEVFLPHSYLGKSGTTLENLPLSITKEDMQKDVPCRAQIDWVTLFKSQNNAMVKIHYSGPNSSEENSLQGAAAMDFLRKQLDMDFSRSVPATAPIESLHSYCDYLAKKPFTHISISGVILQNEKPVEFSYIPGDRTFSGHLARLYSSSKEIPQGLRLLSNMASAQYSILKENDYDTFLKRFQTEQKEKKAPSIRSYTAALLCAAKQEPGDMLRAMFKAGYKRRDVEKALSSKENVFRNRPEFMDRALDELKRPWVKAYFQAQQAQGR